MKASYKTTAQMLGAATIGTTVGAVCQYCVSSTAEPIEAPKAMEAQKKLRAWDRGEILVLFNKEVLLNEQLRKLEEKAFVNDAANYFWVAEEVFGPYIAEGEDVVENMSLFPVILKGVVERYKKQEKNGKLVFSEDMKKYNEHLIKLVETFSAKNLY